MKEINIFIHGIGSSREVWETLISELSRQSKDKHHKQFIEYKNNIYINFENNIYYTFFEYISSKVAVYNDITKTTGSRNEIDSLEIQDLVKQLNTTIKFLKKNFSHINIFGHSLGGVITLRYILDYYQENSNYLNNIVYLASPFSGSENADEVYEKYQSKFFKIIKKISFLHEFVPKPTKILLQLRTNSDFINELLKDIDTNVEILKSVNSYYIFGNNDERIVNPEVTVKKFISEDRYYHVGHGHSTMVEIDNKDKEIYPLVSSVIFHVTIDSLSNLEQDEEIDSSSSYDSEQSINTFHEYFEPCPPKYIENTYMKFISIDKLLKKYTKEKYNAYNDAADIFISTFNLCFNLHLPKIHLNVSKTDNILNSIDENPNFDNLFDTEQVKNLFVNEYYKYPNMTSRPLVGVQQRRRPIKSDTIFLSLKNRMINREIVFLEGNIGEGKSTLLNKLYIDLLNCDDKYNSVIIPLFCIVNDGDDSNNFLNKINSNILNILQNNRIFIDISNDELIYYETQHKKLLGTRKFTKIYKAINNNKILLKDFASLIIAKDLDQEKIISKDEIISITKKLKAKDINLVLIIDNLDSFSYTDERYMFLGNTGFEKFSTGVENVKRITDELSEYNDFGTISIIFALRPYVLTHLQTNNNIGNLPQNNIQRSIVYKIATNAKDYSNESIRSRMELLYDLLQQLSDKELSDKNVQEELKLIIDAYIKSYPSLNNKYLRHKQGFLGESNFEKLYKISAQGYRTIISFFNHLPIHPKLVDNYLTNNDILLLYKLGLYQKYCQILPYKVNGHDPANTKIKQGKSGKDFTFPNLFLVVSNAICNIEYENACQTNIITYWLKYIILNFVKHNPSTSMENILIKLSGDKHTAQDSYYEPHLIKLAVGSLGTVNEYNCLSYDFHTTSMQNVDDLILNTKIKLTVRGETLIEDNELFDISTLQFLIEDWLLPKPKIDKILTSTSKSSLKLKEELKRLMNCKINYEYLTDTNKYSKILRFFIIDKAKLSIWFLTLLEYSLKYEKILYSNAFNNFGFIDRLDNDFFNKRKLRIIDRVTNHILKNHYIKDKNTYKEDESMLVSFLNLCNNQEVTESIDAYFNTVYTLKVPMQCNQS